MLLFNYLFSLNYNSKVSPSVVTFILSLLVLVLNSMFLIFFDRGYGSYQFVSVLFIGNSYLPFLYIGFGLDGLSLCFLLLTSLIVCLCMLTA